MLEVHHSNDFVSWYQYVARTVWAHALAVPEILWVKADVNYNKFNVIYVLNIFEIITFICNEVKKPMANPNMPPITIMVQKYESKMSL